MVIKPTIVRTAPTPLTITLLMGNVLNENSKEIDMCDSFFDEDEISEQMEEDEQRERDELEDEAFDRLHSGGH